MSKLRSPAGSSPTGPLAGSAVGYTHIYVFTHLRIYAFTCIALLRAPSIHPGWDDPDIGVGGLYGFEPAVRPGAKFSVPGVKN